MGYLECNGAEVSRAAYPALFAAIGGTWGAGNGVNTFNLPNTTDRYRRSRGSYPVGLYQGRRNQGTCPLSPIAEAGGWPRPRRNEPRGRAQPRWRYNRRGPATATAALQQAGGARLSPTPSLPTSTGAYTQGAVSSYTAWLGGPNYTTVNLPNHTHGINSEPNHVHGIPTEPNHVHSIPFVNDHTHTITVNAAGGAETRPKTAVFTTIIKY